MRLKLFQGRRSGSNNNASDNNSSVRAASAKPKNNGMHHNNSIDSGSPPSPNGSIPVQRRTNDLKKVAAEGSSRKGAFLLRRKAKPSNNTDQKNTATPVEPMASVSKDNTPVPDELMLIPPNSAAPKPASLSVTQGPTNLYSLPRVLHEFVLAELLDPTDWSRLSQVCQALKAPYTSRIATYKETKINEVSASKLIPPAIFADPLFLKFPPNYRLLAKILNRAGPIIKMMFSKGAKAWQVAALLGMDGALHATYGIGLRDLKDGHGYTVDHYYMILNDRMLVRSHFTRYRPNFKAKTHEDYGFAEIAAAAGSVDILDMFKKSYGYDLNRLNTELDMTLIHCATQFGQGGTVRWLVEDAGVDPRQGRNIVLVAAEHERLSIYNYFIRMDIHARNTAEYNELVVHLAHSGAKYCIETLLEKTGVERMRAVSHEGRTIFSSAIRGGKVDIVMLCLRTGLGKIEQRWNKNWTHLHIAALEGQFKLIRELLKKFPDDLNPHMVDEYNRTMLFYAAYFGNYKEFNDLVTDYYTDEDCLQQDINGTSIVHAACETGKLDFLIQFTNKFGTECLKQTDHRGLTALHYACLGHNLELIEWLVIEHKLSFSTTDAFGKTPLHYLAENAIEDPSLCLWEDLPPIVEKFGIEYITDFRDSSGQSVKDYLEGVVDQSKVLAEINMLSYHRNGYN